MPVPKNCFNRSVRCGPGLYQIRMRKVYFKGHGSAKADQDNGFHCNHLLVSLAEVWVDFEVKWLYGGKSKDTESYFLDFYLKDSMQQNSLL